MRHNRVKVQTNVSLVEEAMTKHGDFMTTVMIAKNLRCATNAVHASLHHLFVHKAADSVISGGKLWWFLTPETDDRLRHIEQRAQEDSKRKLRVRKKKAKGWRHTMLYKAGKEYVIEQHFTPIDDNKKHLLTPQCTCGVGKQGAMFVHTAFDGRPKFSVLCAAQVIIDRQERPGIIEADFEGPLK